MQMRVFINILGSEPGECCKKAMILNELKNQKKGCHPGQLKNPGTSFVLHQSFITASVLF